MLWLSKGLGAGGAEHLLLAVASAADRARVTYDAAYLLAWKQHLVPALEAAGVRTHLLDGPREVDPRWALRLRRLLLDGAYDVLHAHSPYPAALARLVVRTLPRAKRPKLVYTEHNVWSSYRLPTRVLGRLTYRFDDARVAVADQVRSSLPPALAATTETLVHGIDTAAVRAARVDREVARAELGVAADELLVVTMANFRPDKDYANVAAAATRILARVPRARWVVAGQMTTDADADELFAPIDRLHAVGRRDDPWRILAAADVLVVGSRNEGLPVVVMEAMAVGLPIVSTAVGGIPELIRDGVEGRLVPPGRPDLLADAVVEVLDDDEGRAAMGAAAAERSAIVDAARAARRLEDLYEAL